MGRALFDLYRHFGLPGASLILVLEGLGIPIPVEIPLGIVGLRVSSHENSFWSMVMLLWISTVVGNTIGYVIGYYGGRPLVRKLLGWFRVKEETWDRLDRWFRQHGLKLVVLTRWINWGFAQNMWLCGITRMPFVRFFTVMAVNDLLWAAGWTRVATSAMHFVRRGSRFMFIQRSTTRVALLVLTVAIVVLVMYLLVRWIRKRAQRKDSQA